VPGLRFESGIPDYKAGMVGTRPRRVVHDEMLTLAVTQPAKCSCCDVWAQLLPRIRQ
jgi:hypothetical protein